MPEYKIIEHTGDIGIEVEADSENNLFKEAAFAFSSLLIDKLVPVKKSEQEILVEADDLEQLFVRWLSELLYQFEVNHYIVQTCDELKIANNRLSVKTTGSIIDFAVSEFLYNIKAVTYHQLKVEKGEEGLYKARVIFDV